jgi:peptidyl-prolyl cis-trans isomerase A (cyclophilin A)
MRKTFWAALCAASLLVLGSCSSTEKSAGGGGEEKAPDVFKVHFETSRGAIIVEAHRDWAPHGADHLYFLVKQGYYDGNKFFRVIRNFCAQFGINGDPKKTAQWGSTPIPDDPPMHDNTLGSLTFAATGAPNSRTTQLFFNLNNNTQSLNPQGFAPIGVIISGLDVMESLYAGYGEGAPQGMGPDQNQARTEGNAYLDAKFPHLDYIKTARIE